MAESWFETDGIAEVYERHVGMVYRICYAYLKNPADTEDMVQNTFLRLISHGPHFESPQHEKAWLIVTASNLCRDFHRHWWQRRASMEEYENVQTAPPRDADETLQALLDLPDKYKTAMYLYYYEGFDSTEVAQMLKKPRSTIRTYLYRGRKILKIRLGGEFDEE